MTLTTPNGATHIGRLIMQDCHIKYLRNAHMAMDGLSSPLEDAHEDDTVKTLHALCMKKLRPEQLLALAEKITQELEGRPGYKHPAQGQAHDSRRVPVLGYDNRGVKPRSEVSLTKPSELVKLASRVRVDTIGVQPTPKAPQPNASAVANFHARYPGARNIKTL